MNPLSVFVVTASSESPIVATLEADVRVNITHITPSGNFEEKLLEHHDDVDVVTGIVNEDLDGPAIVEAARTVDEDLPVVLGECPPQAATAALAAGADAVIPADVPDELLVHTVKMAGDSSRAEEAADCYRTLVETVGDVMYLLDETGTIEYINETNLELSEYTRDELIGRSVAEILPEESVKRGTECIKELLASPDKKWTRFEFPLTNPDGHQRHFETKLAVLTDDAGAFEGSVGIIREITGRKEAELELKRQIQQLEQFASVVSHDLRNPLTVARGHLENALHEDDLSRCAQEALVSLERMETIIEDVLTLVREPDDVAPAERIDLKAVVNDAWASVATEGATLMVVTPGTIEGDRSRIQQLFENLFRNAVEHSSGPITVRVGRTDEGFYVEDTGPGIPEGIGEEVFEWEVTSGAGGTGLGLAIVAQIAHVHGWNVSLAERDEGGARIEFTMAPSEE